MIFLRLENSMFKMFSFSDYFDKFILWFHSVDVSEDDDANLVVENLLNNVKHYFTLDNSIKKKNPNCAICIYKYKKRDSAVLLKCEHVFHTNCILKWSYSSKNKNCPLCRGNLFL